MLDVHLLYPLLLPIYSLEKNIKRAGVDSMLKACNQYVREKSKVGNTCAFATNRRLTWGNPASDQSSDTVRKRKDRENKTLRHNRQAKTRSPSWCHTLG